jgi:methylmalonyl-CoA/ethylmalonyl-CoA epimerase
MQLEFHHIGLATQNISEALRLMSQTGSSKVLTGPVTDALQNTTVQMVEWNGVAIELIAGADKENPVEHLLKKKINLYHICYGTNNFKETLDNLKQQGWLEVSPPKPAKLFENKLITFLYHPLLGLIELLEN